MVILEEGLDKENYLTNPLNFLLSIFSKTNT
jgi:hypothetical protein